MASTVRSQCGEQWQLDLGETRQDPSELLMDDTIYGGGVIVRDEDTPRVKVRMAQEGRRGDGARAIHRGAPEMRWSSRAVVRAAADMEVLKRSTCQMPRCTRSRAREERVRPDTLACSRIAFQLTAGVITWP